MSAKDNPPGSVTNTESPSVRVVHQPKPSTPISMGSNLNSSVMPPPIMLPSHSVKQNSGLFSPTRVSPNPSSSFRPHSRASTLRITRSSSRLRQKKISDIKAPPPISSMGLVKGKDGKYRKVKGKITDFDPLSISRPASRISRSNSVAPSRSSSPLSNWAPTPPIRAASVLEHSDPIGSLPVPLIPPSLPLEVIDSMPPPPPPDYVKPGYMPPPSSNVNSDKFNARIAFLEKQLEMERMARDSHFHIIPLISNVAPNVSPSHSITPTNTQPPATVQESQPVQDSHTPVVPMFINTNNPLPTPTYNNPVHRSPSPSALSYVDPSTAPPVKDLSTLDEFEIDTIHAANLMAENRDFISELDEVDQGSASSPRNYETVSPIPIPSDFPISLMADMARSLNRVTTNMDILFRRQECSMRQSLTLCNQLRKSFVDLEYSTNQKLDSVQSGLDLVDRNTNNFSDKLENVHIDVGKSIDLITNFRTAFGKSRYSVGSILPPKDGSSSPLSSSVPPSLPMPNLSRDLKKITSNISSLSAQIGSIQSSMKRPSSPVSHVPAPPPHASVSFLVPSSRPLPPILRNATPGPSATPRPKTPIHTPSRPNTPRIPEDLYLNFSIENINEGHVWFTEKAISLPEDNISWWARVLSLARWGPLKKNGYHVGVEYFQTPVLKKRLFILDCI